MFIYLIRHGETPWNAEQRILGATDIGLTPTGLRQAEALSDALSDRPIRAVYSSDLSRALRTAEALARPHALEIRARPGLREMNQGFLEGLTFEELRDQHPDFLESWKQDPSSIVIPGGESLGQLQERVWKAVQELAEVHPDSPAEMAGMRRGDVVVSIDGQQVKSLRELQGILSRHEPGNEVELAFTRRGESMSCKLKLARLADVMPEPK